MKRRFEPSETSRPASRHRPSYQNLATRCKYISETPFAYGAFRSVCEGEYTEGRQSGEPCVLKKFIKGGVFEDRYFSEDIKAVGRSKDIIHAFNTAGFVNKTMYMNEAAVWRHLEPDANGRHECVLVEPKIEGEFVKFNSNTGYTNGADVMQALSHFSYHHTNGQEVLCDLQGGRYDTCYVLTDPVIMSRTGTYGTTDLGAHGISNFFFHHKCNQFCKAHWKKGQAPRSHFNKVAGTTMMGAGGPVGSMGTGALGGGTSSVHPGWPAQCNHLLNQFLMQPMMHM